MKVICEDFYSFDIGVTSRGIITLHPDTSEPGYVRVRIYVAPDAVREEIRGTCIIYHPPDRATVRRNRKGKIVLLPEKDPDDSRCLLIAGFNRPGHGRSCSLNEQFTTADMLAISHGSGDWGAGFAFAALMRPGDRVVDTAWRLFQYDGNEINFSVASEAELAGE